MELGVLLQHRRLHILVQAVAHHVNLVLGPHFGGHHSLAHPQPLQSLQGVHHAGVGGGPLGVLVDVAHPALVGGLGVLDAQLLHDLHARVGHEFHHVGQGTLLAQLLLYNTDEGIHVHIDGVE